MVPKRVSSNNREDNSVTLSMLEQARKSLSKSKQRPNPRILHLHKGKIALSQEIGRMNNQIRQLLGDLRKRSAILVTRDWSRNIKFDKPSNVPDNPILLEMFWQSNVLIPIPDPQKSALRLQLTAQRRSNSSGWPRVPHQPQLVLQASLQPFSTLDHLTRGSHIIPGKLWRRNCAAELPATSLEQISNRPYRSPPPSWRRFHLHDHAQTLSSQ